MTTINPNINVQNTNGAQNVNSQIGSSGQNTVNSAANTDFMKKTSENDLVEFDESSNNGANSATANATGANAATATNSGAVVVPTTTTTVNPTAASTIDTLQMQQESITKQLEQLNRRLENAQKRYKSAQAQLSKAKSLGKDTDAINEVISDVSSSISEINSKISQCTSTLNNISSQMTQAINNLYNTTTTNVVANTTETANVNGAAAGNIAGVNYNTQKAQALADAATELHGSNPSSGGMCGQGVSESIGRGLGLNISGNGCDYKDLLRNDSNFIEVTDSFPTIESLDNLPAGAIVSWAPYNTTSAGNTYGHVFIADGKGNEISDFCAPMNNAHYADGGSWTVFLPA